MSAEFPVIRKEKTLSRAASTSSLCLTYKLPFRKKSCMIQRAVNIDEAKLRVSLVRDWRCDEDLFCHAYN